MGWSPMVLRFVDGGETPVPLDPAVVREVLEPYDADGPGATEGEDGSPAYRVRAADGSEAEIFADDHGLTVHRPHAGEVWDIVAELVARLGAVVLDPSGTGVVCRAEEHGHLPARWRDDAVVIEMTGEALETALTGRRRG
ncbi:hypothetical protein [Streptomyces neyagawaensis]|uniref:hypothetical protein n=1 Tax=Streptomyces neyagawaensis TaxID=42238 RepID=UPI0007C6B05C|nr:hypothetical protein [Streptomyces neyagawaensis]MCL6734681.1 hypothetical protein [Streptomyces neyagawaensis]MDE1682155.1 hypothetical protein [Streptomyces neyagawaensis]